MKIRPTVQTPPTTGVEREGRPRPRAGAPADPATRVSISAEAAFVQRVRTELAETDGSPRRDLIDEVRAQVDAGTFERTVDLDTVIDSLLADL